MRRTIVQPADVSATALAELKTWLAISRSNEDDLLEGLLRASLETCESFTGRAPLAQIVEERLDPRRRDHMLVSVPARRLIAAERLGQDGLRAALDPGDYSFAIQADGRACLTLQRSDGAMRDAQAIVVRIEAGIADVWEDVPEPLARGIVRLAAFEYRDRDRPPRDSAAATPPASVIALWRPWRAIRLA